MTVSDPRPDFVHCFGLPGHRERGGRPAGSQLMLERACTTDSDTGLTIPQLEGEER